MWEYKHTDELCHYGALGMKWGVLRSDAQLAIARKARKPTDEDHDDYKKAHSSKSVRSMSDKELRERNNRLNMEKQYADLTKKASTGKKIVSAFVTTATTVAAVTNAYNTYKKVAVPAVNKGLDKIGDKVLKSIDLTGPLTS